MFKNVIREQSLALDLLSTQQFPIDQLIYALEESSGTLIVTGMGKSGHVARKVASTFTSLGQPAHYLNPADAAHGDLGIIRPLDVVLVLSKSGSTAEIRPVVDYARVVGATVVCITAKPESFLGTHADISFILPSVAESCHLELAPTTSTTMMTALGDAMAVTWAVEQGFTREDFYESHPGGSLGQELSR